jgi:hypothetical protein
VVAEVEVSEPGAVSLKTAWKKVTGRNHAGASTYLIRTTLENAASANIVHSDSLLVNPAEVSKVVDAQGKPLVVYHGTTKDFDAFSNGTGWFAVISLGWLAKSARCPSSLKAEFQGHTETPHRNWHLLPSHGSASFGHTATTCFWYKKVCNIKKCTYTPEHT